MASESVPQVYPIGQVQFENGMPLLRDCHAAFSEMYLCLPGVALQSVLLSGL
jgi:hypothetical protein